MSEFKDLNLKNEILNNLSQAGYTEPTEIQLAAIPHILSLRDLLGIAQTGTGKTAAFCLPILQNIISSPRERTSQLPRILILVPTRELCSQIVESLEIYGQGLGIKSCAIFGGVGQKDQVSLLNQGVDIVVATPGRLLDLMNQRLLRISSIDVLVLDEADRMLDMGFADDLEAIIEKTPEKKQTLLFSATMPPGIERLARKLLKNPIKVHVAPPSTIANTIEQKIIFCKTNHKYQLLKKILKSEAGLTLVFTTSKLSADKVVEYLLQNRIATGAIHADKKQSERERHLNNFKNQAIKVLVATDIASRGLDIDNVTHVINFDLPLTAETYVHRIGRTGRAGNEGVAISFCDESEIHLLDKIKRVVKNDIPSEKFEGKAERVPHEGMLVKRVKAPTPGKSQEKTAYLDHSKRQKPLEEGEKQKRIHPGFRNAKKKRR